jgi:hypothetical protein
MERHGAPTLDPQASQSYHVAWPSPIASQIPHKNSYELQDRNMEDQRSLGGDETRVNSTASSIHDKEEDLEDGHSQHNLVDINDPNRPKVPIRQRLHHFTWAWYTFPMSTGGLSLLIFNQPNQFPGLKEIGLFVYIVNIIIFTTVSALMATRFFLHRGDFKASITHPREGFFFPTFFLAIATIITSTHRYALPENDRQLQWGVQTVYWGYVAVTLLVAVGQYSYVFASHNFGLQTMMPTWILPIFPIMLSGTIASVIADTQPAISALPVVIGGMTCQGLGISVSFMMYSHMVGRLMSAGKCNFSPYVIRKHGF